jgi:hypothetical protein
VNGRTELRNYLSSGGRKKRPTRCSTGYLRRRNENGCQEKSYEEKSYQEKSYQEKSQEEVVLPLYLQARKPATSESWNSAGTVGVSGPSFFRP